MKYLKGIGIIAVISLFLELVVFQFNSFHLWGKDVLAEDINMEHAILSGIERKEDGNYYITQRSG